VSAKETIEVESQTSFEVPNRSLRFSVFVPRTAYEAGQGLNPEFVEKVKVRAADGSSMGLALGSLVFKILSTVSGVPLSPDDIAKQLVKHLVLESDVAAKVKSMGGHLNSMLESVNRSREGARRLTRIWSQLSPPGTESGGDKSHELLARGEKTIADKFLEANSAYSRSYSGFHRVSHRPRRHQPRI